MSAAVIHTNAGPVSVELFDEDAPKTVENFRKLAADHFYDDIIFHRVIPDFMIQGGCPQGTGTGGPGYTFEDEINAHKIVRGALAMANSGPDSNGSQFFILTADAAPWLDGKHTVFGRVTAGMDAVDAIEALPTGALTDAYARAATADLVLVVGSSLQVYPAADIPLEGVRAGAPMIIVNEERTPFDELAQVVIRGKSGEVLLELLDEAQRRVGA